MPDYSLGKVYKITSVNTELVYIGSTCRPTLAQRLGEHVRNRRKWEAGKTNFTSSFIILDAGDYEIELLEKFPCADKDELRACEQKHIREHGDKACNRQRALLTPEEKIEHKRAYVEANKERLTEYRKVYEQVNKEAIAERKRGYYEDNKERILARCMKYQEANQEKRKQKIDCECGGYYQRHNKSKHLKTKMHLQYVATLSPPQTA